MNKVLREQSQSDYKRLQPSSKLFENSKKILRLIGRSGKVILSYELKYPVTLRGGDICF